jgi:hypothetical protein
LPQPIPDQAQRLARRAVKETSRTACSGPFAVAMSTLRPSTSSSASLTCALLSGERIAQPVAGEVDAKTSSASAVPGMAMSQNEKNM